MLIQKVRVEGSMKKITIPKKAKIEAGDYVQIVKIQEEKEYVK